MGYCSLKRMTRSQGQGAYCFFTTQELNKKKKRKERWTCNTNRAWWKMYNLVKVTDNDYLIETNVVRIIPWTLLMWSNAIQLWSDLWKVRVIAGVKVASQLIPNRLVTELQIALEGAVFREKCQFIRFWGAQIALFWQSRNLNATAEVSESVHLISFHRGLLYHHATREADTP